MHKDRIVTHMIFWQGKAGYVADVKFAFEGSQIKRCLKTVRLQQGEDCAVSKQLQEAVARQFAGKPFAALSNRIERRDSREENLTWPSGNVTQGNEGREAAMLETFLAGPWCCQCDPALPWCSWTVRFTRNRVSFVDVELPLDVRLYHGHTLPSCSAA